MAETFSEAVDLATLTVTRQELATLLGLSSARIGQMVGEGTIPAPETHGRYRLTESVKRYCEYTRADSKSKGSKKFTDARAEWMASKARKAAIEEKALSNEFVPMEAVTEAWCAIGAVMRQKYLAVPSRLAAQFSMLQSPQAVFDLAMREVDDVLEELHKLDVKTIPMEWEDKPDDEAAA